MTDQLVECIPNFSEGRRAEVVQAIEAAIASVSGIQVLDRHTDPDHNRTVITFAGPPPAVLEGAFQAILRASQLIDLDQHRGEHPRIGATDVVPFVPLAGVTMDDCVELARLLGRRVGEELGIPVYLYERAATRPERVNLENIRRGEFEGLKQSIATDPERTPDFGPARLGKAGATVIGARPPLIAYNVYLDTDDVGIAKKVAHAVRQSSGGLPYVKALGMSVEGRAQVSMNLTDYTQTPVERAVEAVRREAQALGVGVHHTELVGLIPQQALIQAARWYLQLESLKPDQVLETRLYAKLGRQAPFLEQLAAPTPAPGGGSAAAYAAAMASALVAMVAGLTVGKKKYAQVAERMQQILARSNELRVSLESAVRRDALAFDRVMQAMRMPKETEPQQVARMQAIEQATHLAAAVPLEVARCAVEAMNLAAEVAQDGNVNAASDAASAGALARAALSAAGYNVQANASSASDKQAAKAWLSDLRSLQCQARQVEVRLHQALKERAGLTP